MSAGSSFVRLCIFMIKNRGIQISSRLACENKLAHLAFTTSHTLKLPAICNTSSKIAIRPSLPWCWYPEGGRGVEEQGSDSISKSIKNSDSINLNSKLIPSRMEQCAHNDTLFLHFVRTSINRIKQRTDSQRCSVGELTEKGADTQKCRVANNLRSSQVHTPSLSIRPCEYTSLHDFCRL